MGGGVTSAFSRTLQGRQYSQRFQPEMLAQLSARIKAVTPYEKQLIQGQSGGRALIKLFM